MDDSGAAFQTVGFATWKVGNSVGRAVFLCCTFRNVDHEQVYCCCLQRSLKVVGTVTIRDCRRLPIQFHYGTRSSYVVTLSRPPTVSSLKITGGLFPHVDIHHLVFGMNFQIHFVTRQHPQSCLGSSPHSLVNTPPPCTTLNIKYSFTLSLQAPTFSTNPSNLNSLPTGLPYGLPSRIMGLDRAYIVSCSFAYFCPFFVYIFQFIPCARLSWLPGSQQFDCTLNTQQAYTDFRCKCALLSKYVSDTTR